MARNLSNYRSARREWLGKLNHWPAKATNERVELGAYMHLRGNALRRSTPQNEDYHLAGAIGLVLAGYVGFFLYLYWLMQPTVSAKPELAGYRAPPKTVVRPADSPSVPPTQPEALPMPAAAETASAMAKSNVTEKPKKEIKETKKREARTTNPRRARPVRQQPTQPTPFWGYASSSRSYGSRPWF